MSETAPARGLPGATVLQIVPSLDDTDDARSAVDIAHALLRAGARAIVAGGNGPLVSELQGLGGEYLHMDVASANPLRLRAAVRAIDELIAAERIDIVHARGADAARAAAQARARTTAWLAITFADEYRAPLRADRRYMKALAAADCVIAHSRFLADFIVANGPMTADRLRVIPPRIDTERFDPAAISRERGNLLRRSWKVQANDCVLLVPGPIDPGKGQITLAEAARILVNGGLNRTVFVLAGSSREHADYARDIHAQAEAYGVGAIIRPVGLCADMPAAYATADFVLIPAIVPPTFSYSAAEAQSTGRPVIASAVGALPEIVLTPPHVAAEARTGWLAQGDDPIEFARAISAALATSPSELRAISLRARTHAETMVAPARIAAATLAVYTSLLEGSR